jgi:hypothetical protein
MNTQSSFLGIFVALISASMATVIAQGPRLMATVADNAPVTIAPEPGRTPLATLAEGTQVQVLGPAEDGWYRIAFQDNYLLGDRIGYVRAEHLRMASAPLNPTAGRGGKGPGSSTTPDEGRKGSGSATNRRALRGGLTDSSIAEAIVAGRMQKSVQGLRLLENGQPWTQSSSASIMTSRFRLQLHTPLAWIRQIASEAASDARTFKLEDVTDEMTEPVLRVTAYSAPTNPSSPNRACWVRHVVLRGATKDSVVQPLSKVAFSEHVVSATGGSTVFEGVRLTFPMDAVRRLRGPRGDGEFFIGVIGAAGEEKDLKIIREYLQDLPM